MLTQEHAQTALDFLEKADRHFAEGDLLQASEKFWSAAAHAVLSITVERSWAGSSHREMKTAAIRLADEHGDPLIRAGFIAAEYYHRNFCHGFLEAYQWEADRPVIHDFVARVLALLEQGGSNNGLG